MRWGRAKNSYGNTTTTKLIKKQGGFRQDSAQSLQDKFMKYYKIRPSCTILKTKDYGITIDKLGRIWVKCQKITDPNLSASLFWSQTSQIRGAFAWIG